MPLFNKILIANRGEIACRAIRTAKTMGILTVAVHSEADSRARHVRMADEAILLGGNAPAESYLNIDKILDACKQTGADAVYPGYGFLSENSAFANALQDAGITFIGPNVRAIEAMGDKITSKKIAEEAGVNVIPGHTAVLKDAAEAVTIAANIGYPVMLKASAGGGGKGMRVAFNEAECIDGFARAQSEAISSFGDDRIFIEKYIEQPRHIEIQLIADKHGKVITLNERECSIQRRHQKVIEEAPSPLIDAATRKAMSEQAILLAQAVEYVSAGTVELIADKNRNFYFLEMNTRLQVEHPVTEMITGVDLIELMIRVAAGEPLPMQQSEVKLQGWAIEARVYAENPMRNFVPSIGRLKRYVEPQASDSIRVDSGVEEGDDISMFYDPMISKLISYAPDRKQAIEAMQLALDQYTIQGVDTNIGFLSSILQQPRFLEGDLDTNFIDTHYPDGYDSATATPDSVDMLIPLVATLHYRYSLRAAQLSGQLRHHDYVVPQQWVLIDQNGEHHGVEICDSDNGDIRVEYQNRHYFVKDDWIPGQPRYTGDINGHTIAAQIRRDQYRFVVSHRGYELHACVLTPRIAELSRLMPEKKQLDLSKFLLSPMPGLLISLKVKAGDKIDQGEELAVIEAMKMENSIRAEKDCVVETVFCEPGSTLLVDQKILSFE